MSKSIIHKIEDLEAGPSFLQRPSLAQLHPQSRPKQVNYSNVQSRPTVVQVDVKNTVAIEYSPTQVSTLALSYQPQPTQSVKPIVPTIFEDVARYFAIFLLMIAVTVVSIFKIHQVQETRNLTASVNELDMYNNNLKKEWMSLLAQKQELTENVQIRQTVSQKLGMITPKTEDEIILTIQ